MERIQPEWVRSASDAESVVMRVFTDRPFFEVRVASDPKLFLEENESARSHGINYWASSPSGRPLPAAPEQEVRVPDDVVKNTLGRGSALYYLLVSYADEMRRRAVFSADPSEALSGAVPYVRPRPSTPPVIQSVAQSLLFDPAFVKTPAQNGGGIAAAYDSKSSSAAIEFLGLKKITGGNKRDNVYFVTTGGTKNGALSFQVKVRNRNDVWNFRKCKFILSLNRVTDTNPPQDIPIQIGADDPKNNKVEPYVSRWPEIEDESSSIIPFELSQQTIQRLYDPDNPKARLDFEFHWFEGGSDWTGEWYYTPAVAAFYLVEPANFLWSKATLIKNEIRLNNYKHVDYWTPLAEHTFGKGDKQPVVVKGTVTYGIGKSGSKTLTKSSQVTATQTTADRNVDEIDVRVSAERSQTAKAGIKLEGLMDLGLESGSKLGVSAGYKKIHDVTKTTSDTQQFMTSLSESRGFTENLGTSLEVTRSIEAKNPGRIRVLYAYPVFELWSVPTVLYQQVTDSGMAGARKPISDLPILKFKSIGTCIVELDPKTGEVLGGDCVIDKDEALKETK